MLEAWVQRRPSQHTRRAYRKDVLTFIDWLSIRWPENGYRLLSVSVMEVQSYRQWLAGRGAAPKTIHRRISSLSGFYKYVGACAAELRLPVTIPNPAHAQFIARGSTDPVEETLALSPGAARVLMSLPDGASIEALRDRAILKLYLFTGIRLATGCRLDVTDFSWDGPEASIRLGEKGDRRRTIGLHYQAAQAIQEYLGRSGFQSGPLFRPLHSARSRALAGRRISAVTMYKVILAYLRRLPGAISERLQSDGTTKAVCRYTPHSLRATTATLLLDAGVDITKVQALLGHRHITTTQIYDKRRRTISDSASHEVPL